MSNEPVTKEDLALVGKSLKTQVELISGKVDQGLQRMEALQTLLQTSASLSQTPPHPYGLCSNEKCDSCVTQAQDLTQAVAQQARQEALLQLEDALTWAQRPDIANMLEEIFQAWTRAGAPARQRSAA